jgi:hypothetical protein
LPNTIHFIITAVAAGPEVTAVATAIIVLTAAYVEAEGLDNKVWRLDNLFSY